MAVLTITNLTDEPVYLGDFYTSVPVDGKLEVCRSPLEISLLRSLEDALNAEKVSMTVSLSKAEEFSGFSEIISK